METTPTIDQASDFFDAHTVELVDVFPFAEVQVGPDKISIVLSPAASVEFKSVIEEVETTSDVITSFFEDETSDEPWLVVEPC